MAESHPEATSRSTHGMVDDAADLSREEEEEEVEYWPAWEDRLEPYDLYAALHLRLHNGKVSGGSAAIRSGFHRLSVRMYPGEEHEYASTEEYCAAVVSFRQVCLAFAVLTDSERARTYEEGGFARLQLSETYQEPNVFDMDPTHIYESFFAGSSEDDREYLLLNGAAPPSDSEDDDGAWDLEAEDAAAAAAAAVVDEDDGPARRGARETLPHPPPPPPTLGMAAAAAVAGPVGGPSGHDLPDGGWLRLPAVGAGLALEAHREGDGRGGERVEEPPSSQAPAVSSSRRLGAPAAREHGRRRERRRAASIASQLLRSFSAGHRFVTGARVGAASFLSGSIARPCRGRER